jgi:hypothetical protein
MRTACDKATLDTSRRLLRIMILLACPRFDYCNRIIQSCLLALYCGGEVDSWAANKWVVADRSFVALKSVVNLTTPPWPGVRRGMLKDKSIFSRFIHPMDMHLISIHPISVHLISVYLMGVCLMSMHLIGAHLMLVLSHQAANVNPPA